MGKWINGYKATYRWQGHILGLGDHRPWLRPTIKFFFIRVVGLVCLVRGHCQVNAAAYVWDQCSRCGAYISEKHISRGDLDA